MKNIAITAVLGLLCATSIDAQVDSKKRVRDDILEKQRRMREGKLVRANVRVTVRLKNGSRLRGVVKQGRFIERLDNVEFVEARQPGPNAGLRLWYYDDTDSYIFLPYRSIKHYKIGERLSDEEVAAIAKRIAEARKKSAQRREQQQQHKANELAKEQHAKEQQSKSPKQPAKPGSETDADSGSQLTAAQRQLLAEFPPEKGWGVEKLEELERRKINIGVYPNATEAKFIENFGAWNDAYEIWKAEKELAEIEKAEKTPAPTKQVESPTKKAPQRVPPVRLPTPTGGVGGIK